MSTATEHRTDPAILDDEDPQYPITADQFLDMIEAGVFPEEARVYLHDGRIREKMAKTRYHWGLGGMIQGALIARVPPGWLVVAEGEFKTGRTNTALPDLAVIRGESFRAILAPGRRPEDEEIGLAVEISITSVAKDLGSNVRRYARAMIPTYWVADFNGKRLVVHSGPRVVKKQAEYEHVQVVTAGGRVPLVLGGEQVAVFSYEDLMP